MTIPISFPVLEITGSFYRDSLILANDLEQFGNSIRSFREPLTRSVRRVIIPSIRKNFDSEGRPEWEQLKGSTVTRRGATGPILRRSGKLKRVATQFNIWRIDTDSAAITGLNSRNHYAKYHQGGTKFMVSRPFVMYQPEDLDDIEEVFADWLDERMQRLRR